MPTHFPVRIDGRSFIPADQSVSNDDWVRALSFAHLKEICHCMCKPGAPVLLTVRLYNRDKPTMRHGLALWPGTGLDHDAECAHFDETDGGDGGGDHKGAFDDLGDGKIRAHLSVALSIAQAHVNKQTNPTNTPRAPSPTRARASEVALLLKLWRTAGLNIYKGAPKSWFSAVFSIMGATKRFIVNKSGDTLADFVLIASGSQDKLVKAHNAHVMQRAADKPSRLFVIGRLRAYRRERPQTLLPFRDNDLLPKILVKVDQLDALFHARPLLSNLLEGRDGNVIGFACIESTGNGWWKTISLTAIATTESMIPVESSFEIEFAEYLGLEGRTYLKPIIVDEMDGDGNRPDFILLDTVPKAPCEVWGMRTPEYLADKIRRLARYAQKRQRVVSWNANPREPLPVLPAKSI